MREIILLVIVIILFILAIIRSIDWRGWALKLVGNNPARSQHYIEAGDTVHTVEGHRILMESEGQVYAYVDLDKEIYIIDVPSDYPYKYIRGRRIIGQADGQLVPDPLGYFRREQVEQINEGLTDISRLTESGVLIKAIHSVKSNRSKSIITWVLIGALAVGAFLWYRNNQADKIGTDNVTQQMQPVTPPVSTPVSTPAYEIKPITTVVP